MRCQPYGTTADRQGVDAYTLENASGLRAQILSLGCVIARLEVPDRDGVAANVVLGLESVDGYMTRSPHFGAIAGRFANRIAGGRFSIDGTAYQLDLNAPPNAMHGGKRGFHKRVWQAESPGGETLVLRYLSADGEEGFPGNLSVAVTYRLTDVNELHIIYQATTDKPTIVNLTNHSYFNLAGCGTILDHELRIDAVAFTPTDDALLPTGAIAPVGGAIDFTARKRIGRDWAQLKAQPTGYDHNFVLADAGPDPLRRVAWVHAPASGRVMAVSTDLPCLQLYTGNFLDGTGAGKGGKPHRQYAGLCLETQRFPDAMNHAGFPPCVLQPGETFRTTTVYAFGVE